ncbi:bifunctional pyr operon transcriptional regulator/uracil phosphoribosyltransferase PyrR [Pararobbsia silviterrae]|uniref:Bifunctional pyr operon transcriptional regulator/uracil phosphoribosyltransferase PyrR n=1 Tax=Pararobbsia silviterrae TaxID=1792498 RepID=A0A494Y9M4_9BURK|nr:bifunctional pyr operon transcriptional regulator/uracil phosphoribosyltransferase PyrR [Pararobbsia silviterrae]RKP59056.1 bifunctional pyr operon transcriptional regulator/uracil phosphoribosyltransferase PyrR [Pararobbsia silviterrae]
MTPFDAEALYTALREQLRAAYPDWTRADSPVLAGIHTGGAWIAERLAAEFGVEDYGTISVALHRDDYSRRGLQAEARATSLPFAIEGRRVVLVDDVLNTGRTVRAAINELYDFGRPAAVELAVLVDRGGRELPYAARFAGAVVDTVPAGTTLVLERDEAGASGRFTFGSEAARA